MSKSSKVRIWLASAALAVALAWPVSSALGQKPGKGGGGDSEEPPPVYNLPPFSYAVDVVPVPGMGRYFDTNDYGVSVVSMRPDWDPDAPANLATNYRHAAAAVVYPVQESDGTFTSQVYYLDQLIDPELVNYDLGAAVDINNAGQILASGWDRGTNPDISAQRAFLLTPNANAAEDGFAYNITLMPTPEWAYQTPFTCLYLSEAEPNSGSGHVYYYVYGEEQAGHFVRYGDGTWKEIALESGASAEYMEINVAGTLKVENTVVVSTNPTVVDRQDYLRTRAGVTINAQKLGEFGPSMSSLADNGYSAGEQTRIIGYEKVRGGLKPIYRTEPVYYKPDGSASWVPLRADMNADTRFMRINEQMVGGKPMLAVTRAMILVYPGYDPAYLRELMSPSEQLEFDDLGFQGFFKMTTPRINGDVDHQGAPSFFEGANGIQYPDGSGGHEGIYMIRPTPLP